MKSVVAKTALQQLKEFAAMVVWITTIILGTQALHHWMTVENAGLEKDQTTLPAENLP